MTSKPPRDMIPKTQRTSEMAGDCPATSRTPSFFCQLNPVFASEIAVELLYEGVQSLAKLLLGGREQPAIHPLLRLHLVKLAKARSTISASSTMRSPDPTL